MRLRPRRMLVLISLLTASLMLMLLAYGGVGAFAVEGAPAVTPAATPVVTSTATPAAVPAGTPLSIDEAAFVTDVVANANAYWGGEFARLGLPYRPANLQFVYEEPIDGGCGQLYPEYGPGYCGYEETLYYPVSWAVPGGQPLEEYGYAAVAMGMAHETGHHVQMQMDELGIRGLDGWTPVQNELQADCFAGMWSRRADARFGDGGTEAILTVLSDLGASTHGTAEQRISAFEDGYYTGDLSRCLALTA